MIVYIRGQVCNSDKFSIPLNLKHKPPAVARVQFIAVQKRAVQSFATEIASTLSETLLPRIARSLLWVREESVLALCARRDTPRNPGGSRTRHHVCIPGLQRPGYSWYGSFLIHAMIVHEMAT